MTKIKSGQANFDNCTIVGDLNLSKLNVDKDVHFNNTIFEDSVNCISTTFSKVAYFESSKLNGTAGNISLEGIKPVFEDLGGQDR